MFLKKINPVSSKHHHQIFPKHYQKGTFSSFSNFSPYYLIIQTDSTRK